MKEFWIKNISRRNVSLRDLNLTVPIGKTFNLLNARRFPYLNEALILESYASGSLYKKRDKVIKCNAPSPIQHHLEMSTVPMIVRPISVVKVEEKVYEELILSDEKMADEFSEDLIWDPKKKGKK